MAKEIVKKTRTTKGVAKKSAKKAVATRARSPSVYQIKITLREVKPAVWRRILIESDKTMLDFYGAIIDSMGWTGYHLFAFNVPSPYGDIEIGMSDESEWGLGNAVLPASDEPMKKWINPKSPKIRLDYDFGDGWEHNVVLEKVLPREAQAKYPQCVAGKRACPPEDIGGPGGYDELMVAIKDPHNPKYRDLLEGVIGKTLEAGDDIRDFYDPDDFSPEEVAFVSTAEWLKMPL